MQQAQRREEAGNRNYRAVIFDFNGVLVWDGVLHREAWRQCAQRHLGRVLGDGEFNSEILGRPNYRVVAYLLGREPTSEESQHIAHEKEALYRQLWRQEAEPPGFSPGAESLLRGLRACGVPYTIATSSERANLDFYHAELNLSRWFAPEDIVYQDGSFPGKPSPDIYMRAAERLGVPPAECVVIEDAESGVSAARAAGIGYVVKLGGALPNGMPGTTAAAGSGSNAPKDVGKADGGEGCQEQSERGEADCIIRRLDALPLGVLFPGCADGAVSGGADGEPSEG